MEAEFVLERPPLDPRLIEALGTLTVLVFDRVETAANRENGAMAAANLSHGFSVCGIRTEPGRVQILYSKPLASTG